MLAGRYRLVSLLGEGGMGEVWRAEHVSLGTPVAIKLIHAEVADHPEALSRFLREARAAAKLRSVNVVQIIDHGVDEGTPYIAMECLEGESLGARLSRDVVLDRTTTANVMTGVCRALARAHRLGIVHRDLKPDNVFLAEDERATVVKVLDFGIAKITDDHTDVSAPTEAPQHRTETGQVLGTPRYMSPEQARGKSDIDGRSDLWSLAVIAFQCLTGRVPFDAQVTGDLVMLPHERQRQTRRPTFHHGEFSLSLREARSGGRHDVRSWIHRSLRAECCGGKWLAIDRHRGLGRARHSDRDRGNLRLQLGSLLLRVLDRLRRPNRGPARGGGTGDLFRPRSGVARSKWHTEMVQEAGKDYYTGGSSTRRKISTSWAATRQRGQGSSVGTCDFPSIRACPAAGA